MIEKGQNNLKIDVAIIGGGVSGIYSGYRILTGTKGGQPTLHPKSVHIFEMRSRICGRLYTVPVESNIPMFKEMGGKRYYPNIHHRVNALVTRALKLETTRNRTERNALGVPHTYVVASADGKGLEPMPNIQCHKACMKIWRKALRTLAVTNGETVEMYSHANWDAKKRNLRLHKKGSKHDNKFVYELDLKTLITELTSWQSVNDPTKAYYENYFNARYFPHVRSTPVNALEGIRFLLNGLEKTAEHETSLKRGYDSVPAELANNFLAEGGTIWVNARVENQIGKRDKEGYYHLTARSTDGNGKGRKMIVRARQIIFAIPKESLELFECSLLKVLDKRNCHMLKHSIHSVRQMGGLKMFVETMDATFRTLLYTLHQDHVNMFQSLLPESPKKQKFSLQSAGAKLADKATTMLRKAGKIPENAWIDEKSAIVSDWTMQPFGAFIHQWKPNVKTWQVMEFMSRPDKNQDVFIAGEAYSTFQGWVEGALQTSETMLQKGMGFDPPEWLEEPPEFQLQDWMVFDDRKRQAQRPPNNNTTDEFVLPKDEKEDEIYIPL